MRSLISDAQCIWLNKALAAKHRSVRHEPRHACPEVDGGSDHKHKDQKGDPAGPVASPGIASGVGTEVGNSGCDPGERCHRRHEMSRQTAGVLSRDLL